MKRAVTGLARIPILSYGFRPFFLGGALWALVAMLLWIGVVTGQWEIAVNYGPLAWHAHEFLFGYVGAIIAGFLLTAIPNWTDQLPIRGGPLLALFLLWLAGRVALLAVDHIGVFIATSIDSLFLLILVLVISREIAAGRNWRNLRVVVLVFVLALADIGFHAETVLFGAPDYSLRVGIAVIISLIMLVGGRIVPSFTHNWLVREGAGRLPISFDRFDMFSIFLAVAALITWIVLPVSAVTGLLLSLAGLAQFLRLLRWAGLGTWHEPLVLVLHVGYAFVPLGFFIVGASVLWPALVPPTGALHTWTAGAMTLMTLAVMTRATRGHTGRELTAGAATQFIYATAILAALARILPLAPEFSSTLLAVSAAAWIAAFGGFVLWYGPMLLRSRDA
jgi:uncharacterized protein involved in response to NO